MHVAMASPWPPWRKGGGTEAHTDQLARALCAVEGVRVTVVSVDIPGREPAPFDVAIADSPFMAWLRRFEGRIRIGRPSVRQVHDVLFNRKAARIARRIGADVLHRQGAYAVGFRSPVPFVLTLHNGTMPADEPTPRGWRHRLLYPLGELDRRRRMAGLRRCLKEADEVICVSEHVEHKILGRLGVRRGAHAIANGCSFPAPTLSKPEARKLLGVAGSERVVLFIGRLSPEKRVQRLLPLADAGCTLVVLGGGELEAQLRAIAAKQPRLRILGFQDEAAKRLWLRAADVLALPSGYFEGNPIVMMEALRSGTPVYGTHAEWLPVHLRRFGEFGDDVMLAQKAMAIDAAPAVTLVPGWDAVAQQTLAVYRSALAKR